MKTVTAILFALISLVGTALAQDEEPDRIEVLEEKVKLLEDRLAAYEMAASPLEKSLSLYLDEQQFALGDDARFEDGSIPVRSKFRFDLGGQLWLFLNVPSSGLGLDAGQTRMDLDYLWLRMSGEIDPFGFRVWMGLRDTPRYTDVSPYGQFWTYETLVYARVPTPIETDGERHETTIEVGKTFVPFGLEWDHSWYGSIIYYKGSMCEADWGVHALGNVPFSEGKYSVDYAFAWFNRSDEIDGASSVAGFGLDGTNFESPEFTDDPTAPDREQRDQWVARLAFNANLGGGVTATVGASALLGDIRLTANDGSAHSQSGAKLGTVRQRDQEVDMKVVWDDADLGFFTVPSVQLLGETMWYNRGVDDQRGQAWLTELYFRLYETETSKWFQTIEVWFGYSADKADDQPNAYLYLPSFGMQLNDRTRFMVEYVSWYTTDYLIDRGLWFHLAFDF